MRVNLGLLLPLMDKYAAPTWAILISGFFMLLSVSLSMYLIFEHLSAYNNPEVCFTTTTCSIMWPFLLFVNKWSNIHLVMFALLQEQKFVLGVILMVPCYAIESVISLKQLLALCWLVIAHLIAYLLIFGTSLQQYVSLVNPDTSVYCGILRDGYEAFAMYCFGRYITACLGEFFSWASETF